MYHIFAFWVVNFLRLPFWTEQYCIYCNEDKISSFFHLYISYCIHSNLKTECQDWISYCTHLSSESCRTAQKNELSKAKHSALNLKTESFDLNMYTETVDGFLSTWQQANIELHNKHRESQFTRGSAQSRAGSAKSRAGGADSPRAAPNSMASRAAPGFMADGRAPD